MYMAKDNRKSAKKLKTENLNIREQAQADERADTPSPGHKIPRPPNCFMVYRMQKNKELRRQRKMLNAQDTSRMVAQMWKEEPASERRRYMLIAKELKAQHMQMYPGYKYAPRRRSRSESEPSYGEIPQSPKRKDNNADKQDAISAVSTPQANDTIDDPADIENDYDTMQIISFDDIGEDDASTPLLYTHQFLPALSRSISPLLSYQYPRSPMTPADHLPVSDYFGSPTLFDTLGGGEHLADALPARFSTGPLCPMHL